ncbi:SDR family NAD(P)-dependent oxidoreductase [Synechococcus sp. RSCCF101]|uniref:SDR family NAD(P)-dependent oxidoreductase n=1 Tax=Synechococcus sp. RSCCF101 TaxID=2511069 RepID=UPI0012474EEC|nr:SDR family NAD(P)-dependent oxidoreductase [Synechococcus sp. RSCCF101]QEY32843.1 SDR family NAD(P)-dependent oxidoreductase [Synechococcus sp. RSCCF101]
MTATPAAPRTVMISGATGGIGRAIAEHLLQEKHRLSLGCREPEALAGTPLGEDPLVQRVAYEATDPDAAERWVARAVDRFGGVDTVVNVAGILSRVPFLFAEGDEAEIRRCFEVNVLGPWWLTRAAWPQLLAHGQGRVINLSSMSGKRVKGTMAAYPVSKFALQALGQAMRNEGWEAGIRVTSICPAWVNTSMASRVPVDPTSMIQPAQIAELVAGLLRLGNAAIPQELALNSQLEIG